MREAHEIATAEVAAADDPIRRDCLLLEEAIIGMYLEPQGGADRLAALVDEALPLFDEAGDEFALHLGNAAAFQSAWMKAFMDAALEARKRSVEHARRAGLPHRAHRMLPMLAAAQFYGTTPNRKLIEWLDEQEAAGYRHPGFVAQRAYALAHLGRAEEARSLVSAVRTEMAE